MDKRQFKILLEEGEGYFVEFKENLSKIDKEIVAFANSLGGKIFVGITDTSTIKGFKLDNRTKSEIQSIAENCDPPIRVSVEKFDEIAIIHVPEGKSKPYRCSSGFYLRNGACSQKMSTDDIIAFIQDEGRVRFDEIFDKRFNFESDFDDTKYQSFIRKCGISGNYEVKEVLQNLGLLNFEDNKFLMNNTGILLFAKIPTKFFVQSVVTGVLYKGTEKLDILDRKDFTGDLISNIEEAILFLKKHLNIRYQINSLQRQNILEIPETALREAVVNSIVHRDYFEKGANVLIEIYDDRVEITNPGGLPKGLKESEFGTKSVTRNPLLASMMLGANYIEKLGTGIKRIQNALKEAHLPPAGFEKNSFFTISIARLITEVDKKDEKTEKFSVILSEELALKFEINFGLKNERLSRILKILVLIYTSKFISTKDFGINFGINFGIKDRTVENDIIFLRKIGFIERIGSRRTGKYVITNKFMEFSEDVQKGK